MVEDDTRIIIHMERKSAKRVGCTNGALRGNFGLLMGILGPLFTCIIINPPVECISLSPVYWNHSNPIFKSSKNDHIVFVNPFDEIDFVCPYYAAPLSTTTETNHSASPNAMEFYLIYQVSKSEYDECFIMSSSDSGSHRLLLSCTQPVQRRRFTIWFDPFQSVPRVPEYKPRHSYYFITTSTGHQSGLNNLLNGACAMHNMKLTIRIGDIVDADDDVDDERTDDVTRNSDRIKNTERLHDDDDDDDDENRRRHLHHHPHHQQLQRQDHQHHHHHPHTGRPMFRHEKGLSLNSSSSSSSSSSFVYSRRNLSRHLSMLAFSSRSSSDPLTSSAKKTTSGAPRDFVKDAVYDVSQKDRRTEAKDRQPEGSSRSEEHRAVRLRQNTPKDPSSSAAEEREGATSDAAPLSSLLPRAILLATSTSPLPFTNCIAIIPLYATLTIGRNFGLL